MRRWIVRAAAVQRLCKRGHADYDATHLSLLHDDGCNIACVTSSLDVISSALSQTNQVSCMVAGTISESFLKPSMTPEVAGGAHQTDGKAKHAKADDSCVCNRLAHIQRTTFRVSTCSHSDNQQSVEQTTPTQRDRTMLGIRRSSSARLPTSAPSASSPAAAGATSANLYDQLTSPGRLPPDRNYI